MDKLDELLTRGVAEVLPNRDSLKKLAESRKLRVYQGFDPTAPELHIGHMVGLRKLKQWQDLGHEVIFLIGDFTGQIGDPTGKEETRPLLSKEIVQKNAKTYKEQAGKILDFNGKNPVKIMFNSNWLEKLSTAEFLNLASQVTYQQVIKRGMFKKRLENDEDISMNEILYPVMQGYDSVAMDVDVEVGGSDQLFNMMMGRDLMHKMKRKNKFVMTTPLLVDSDGNKLGKTTGNAIALTAPSEEIFGGVMNFPDSAIIKALEYLTDVSLEEIKAMEKEIQNGVNPIQYKKLLAFEIVKQLSGQEAATKAQKEFESKFQKGNLPQSFDVKVKADTSILDAVTTLIDSKSQVKRLLDQGAIEIDGKVATDGKVKLSKGQALKVGKKIFAKVE
ncbi:MAG: tyrosine--tRNA ligase [Patescibacteria group bacterium]